MDPFRAAVVGPNQILCLCLRITRHRFTLTLPVRGARGEVLRQGCGPGLWIHLGSGRLRARVNNTVTAFFMILLRREWGFRSQKGQAFQDAPPPGSHSDSQSCSRQAPVQTDRRRPPAHRGTALGACPGRRRHGHRRSLATLQDGRRCDAERRRLHLRRLGR